MFRPNDRTFPLHWMLVALALASASSCQLTGQFVDPVPITVEEGEDEGPIIPVKITVPDGRVLDDQDQQRGVASSQRKRFYDLYVQYEPADYLLLQDTYSRPPDVTHPQPGHRRLVWKYVQLNDPRLFSVLVEDDDRGDIHAFAVEAGAFVGSIPGGATRFRPARPRGIDVYPRDLNGRELPVDIAVNTAGSKAGKYDVYLGFDPKMAVFDEADPAPYVNDAANGKLMWKDLDASTCIHCVFEVDPEGKYRLSSMMARQFMAGDDPSKKPLDFSNRRLAPPSPAKCP